MDTRIKEIADNASTSIVASKEYTELEKQINFLKSVNRKAYNKMRKQATGKFSDTLMKRLKK